MVNSLIILFIFFVLKFKYNTFILIIINVSLIFQATWRSQSILLDLNSFIIVFDILLNNGQLRMVTFSSFDIAFSFHTPFDDMMLRKRSKDHSFNIGKSPFPMSNSFKPWQLRMCNTCKLGSHIPDSNGNFINTRQQYMVNFWSLDMDFLLHAFDVLERLSN